MNNKIFTAAEAVADIQDGAHIGANFWGISGSPGLLLRALVDRGVQDLTIYINNFLPIPNFLREAGFPDPTIILPQVKKVVAAFVGTRAFFNIGGDFLGERVKNGQLEIEMTTHGVLVDRLHAGAMGQGGFFSPIGINTSIEKGKEKRTIDGQEYVFEKPIRLDVGLIKAYKADTMGNLVYRGTGRGANPVIAMASKLTIAEVFEIVEPGQLDPEAIVTPGVYVDRIVRVPDEDVTSLKRRSEFAERLRALTAYRMSQTKNPQAGGQP